jgi:hypothetical protein
MRLADPPGKIGHADVDAVAAQAVAAGAKMQRAVVGPNCRGSRGKGPIHA